MRILSAPLLAAQKSASAVPYLKVVISDRIGGIRRLAYSRLYTGSEPDSYHAAAMPGDGSLLRARATSGHLYYQRVANPATGSDFASWSDVVVAANAGVALCAQGSRALLFYVDADGIRLRLRESTDNGATLGTVTTVATAASPPTWLAADVKTNGDALLLYSVGLACYHQGDWNTVVAGAAGSGEALLWSCAFGDGVSQAAGTWSALREVTRACAGSSVNFRAAFLSQPDTYRLTFVEKYAGSASYSRPQHSFSPATADYAFNRWREPVPFDLTSDFGQAIAFSSSAAWLSTPSGVWSAGLATPSLDVTSDVLEATTHDRPFDGRVRLTLRNDDGRYSALPSSLKIGAEVRVSPGYATSTGKQTSDSPTYWIESIERTSGRGSGTVEIKARDGWGLLEAWRARRQYSWAAGETNVSGTLGFMFSRAGLEFASSGASTSNLYPAFTVHPGESGLTAVRRLLATIPDVIFMRGEFALLTDPVVSESTDYAYGTDHPLLSARYADELPIANRVQVFGNGPGGEAVLGERFDWPGLQSTYDRLVQVLDRNLTTAADAESRADTVLRDAALAAASGEITVPVNCAQELYDVIEVTDAVAGLAAARRRVLGLSLRYSTGERTAYEQRITLGGV